MTEFLAAIAAFLVAHVVPPAPPVRSRLIAWLGQRTYLASYSLVSLALIVWIILAAGRAPYLPLWEPATWQALVPLLVMPFAAWLVIAGLAEPNALSISLRSACPDANLGPTAGITRHPVLWGFFLWACSHIPPNGDVVSLIMFGGMALLATAGLAVADRRAHGRLGDEQWHELANRTSVVPFVALIAGRARIQISGLLVLSTAAALAAYLWFLLDGHERLIGLDPLARLGG